MKTSTKVWAVIMALAVLGFCQTPVLQAAVADANLGTGNPPATLGGYTMNPFDPGSIGGQTYYEYEINGNGEGALHPGEGEWATWGQNYTGNVYVRLSPAGAVSSGTLSLFLHGAVEAVDFYEEPNVFANFTMTATDSSGASVSTVINGFHGSSGVGFWETVPGGPYLSEISVTCSDPSGFAIGEFGINGGTLTGAIPDGGSSVLLLAIGLLSLVVVGRYSIGHATV